ncbi:hypothetical protein EKE94_03265 [Mesobaculum littorinae]|uniref:Uncharacterized protein n=1 Tax=Mesobaculum littorinae TaxID=2486419 RepID=A0A438AMF1_9RHOB|nr:hypothetical protein EKE94_03265 [Mesobaculum littorinae]
MLGTGRDASGRPLTEAERIDLVRAAGRVPDGCGPAMPEAPARGPVRAFEPKAFYPKGAADWESKPAGYEGRKALAVADAFDLMARAAARSKRDQPFTPTQVAMGRSYAALTEKLAAAGVKLSSVEGRAGGSGQGGDVTDRRLIEAERLAALHRRIGTGIAMEVRRQRPSRTSATDRPRRSFTDRQLIDAVCLEGRTISDVLDSFGWKVYGDTRAAVRTALCKALDRMVGPVRRGNIMVAGGASARDFWGKMRPDDN